MLPDGVVRVAFATIALGMGVHLRDVDNMGHHVVWRTTSKKVEEEDEVVGMQCQLYCGSQLIVHFANNLSV